MKTFYEHKSVIKWFTIDIGSSISRDRRYDGAVNRRVWPVTASERLSITGHYVLMPRIHCRVTRVLLLDTLFI